MRGFDVFFYGLLLTALIVVAYRSVDRAPAPAHEAELDETPGRPLPQPSPFDPQVRVALPFEIESGSGTAFSVSDGVWMTARHVVDGCAEVAILGPGRRGYRASAVRTSARSDVAILDAAFSRDPLPVVLESTGLRIGARGYHVGYPRGAPGEAASRLIGRETLVTQGRYGSREPVLAWAEIGRSHGLEGPLSGMSGGPTFDERGRVVGVTVAESPRRGRIYSAAPQSVRDALFTAGAAPETDEQATETFSEQSYARAARRLRRTHRVAQLLCLAG